MLHRRSSPAVAGAFFGGAVLGAAVSTAILLVIAGLLSPIPSTIRAIIALAALVVLGFRAMGLVSFPLPQNARQIPEYAFAQAPRTAAFRFAFELGTAARTYITKESVYAVGVLVMLLSPRTLGGAAWTGLLVAVGFGLGRSIIIIGQTWRRRAINEHPPWSLQAASATTIAVCVIVALGELLR